MSKMLSMARLAGQVAGRQVTVERLVADTLARIEQANPEINAFITVLADGALADARRLDADLARGHYRGPLHGMPISVKDLVDVEGVPTTAASRVRRGHRARHDAPVIARLREAGAVIIGKTNLHEFAYGTTSEDSAYGPVRNPLDVTRSAGGSSGGSAAAIAAGLCAGSVGTDTGGSIRIPAAACGIVGLKPTSGEITCEGVVPLSRSLDHVGPMAADVASAWMLYRVMAGTHPADAGFHESLDGARKALASLRLGLPRRYFLDLLDEGVRVRFEEAIERLRQAGAHVTDVDVPHAELVGTVYLHIQLPESSAYHAATLEREPELYTPPVRLRLEMGRYVLAEDYARAQQGRDVLRREVDGLLEHVDALALPTLPIAAPSLGQATVRLGRAEIAVRTVMLRLTQLFNVTGHPAISLPSGRTAGGLPTALQLVGRRGGTPDLLRIALGCEALLPTGAAKGGP
jgi:aspartyl-tRNA(Asn)/glutamyl-tRNA(Gln) amidotransferase subunit A